MSDMKLTLASKANQAALLPVLLVATSINEARPTPIISISYEDTAVLEQTDKAVVQFTGVSGSPVSGTENAIQELRKNFPFLNAKDEKLVRIVRPTIGREREEKSLELTFLVHRRTNGFRSLSPTPPWTSRLSTRYFSALTTISFFGPLWSATRFRPPTLPSGVLSVETVLRLVPSERDRLPI